MCPYYLYYLVGLLSNKDNDTYFVVSDGFISILHNDMENAKTTANK